MYRLGLAAALVAAAGSLFWRLGPPAFREWIGRYSFCVIYRFTGFTCPGCGGTRALTMLLAGRIGESFLYHPLVPCGALWYIVFMGSHTGAKLYNRFASGIRNEERTDGRTGTAQGKRRTGLRGRDSYAAAAVLRVTGNFIVKNLLHLFTGMDVLAELDRLFMP